MNKETIEKAAGAYSGSVLGFKDNPIVMAKHKAFTAGADWRIKSVWHNSDEETEERKEILVEYRIMTPDGEIEVRREVVESLDDLSDSYCDVLNWAYIDDLTPERKEETE